MNDTVVYLQEESLLFKKKKATRDFNFILHFFDIIHLYQRAYHIFNKFSTEKEIQKFENDHRSLKIQKEKQIIEMKNNL